MACWEFSESRRNRVGSTTCFTFTLPGMLCSRNVRGVFIPDMISLLPLDCSLTGSVTLPAYTGFWSLTLPKDVLAWSDEPSGVGVGGGSVLVVFEWASWAAELAGSIVVSEARIAKRRIVFDADDDVERFHPCWILERCDSGRGWKTGRRSGRTRASRSCN